MHKKVEKMQEVLEMELGAMLDRINGAGTLSPSEVETMDDAVDLMLKLKEYEMWLCEQEEMKDGRSYGYDRMSYRMGRDADTGRYMSRDYGGGYYDMRNGSYGNDPYMRESYRRGSYGRESFERGYSGHSIKDRMVSQLEAMYDEAQTDHERQMVDEWIKRIESDK